MLHTALSGQLVAQGEGIAVASAGKRGIEFAGIVMLGILLVIILRGVLASFFPPLLGDSSLKQLLQSWPPENITWIRAGQFIVFLVLLARFYGGAYRFNQEHAHDPQNNSIFGTILNVVGTFGLFSLFYVAGVNVWQIDKFYLIVLLVHIFDLLWFIVFLVKYNDSRLAGPVSLFLVWDILTIVAFGILAGIYWTEFLDHAHLKFQIRTLIVLFAISVIDWIVLRNFYFNPEKWRKRTTKKARAGGKR